MVGVRCGAVMTIALQSCQSRKQKKAGSLMPSNFRWRLNPLVKKMMFSHPVESFIFAFKASLYTDLPIFLHRQHRILARCRSPGEPGGQGSGDHYSAAQSDQPQPRYSQVHGPVKALRIDDIHQYR